MGDSHPLVLISGPCVIESEELCLEIAAGVKAMCSRLGISYVFKASFDKANRTSASSFRGPGLITGLAILNRVKTSLNLPILTDIHEISQVGAAAEVVDILQIPAFLCRQTDLIVAAAKTGRTINIKKGQFMAPQDMKMAVDKVKQTGNHNVFLTERGFSFGYNNLIVDMRSLAIMRGLGVPVVFDGTHSVQLPGGMGASSGGQREFVPPLVRAAAAVGIDGLFLETHPDPSLAKSDGPNSIPLDQLESILRQGVKIHELVRQSTRN